jgi:hypothetical protein
VTSGEEAGTSGGKSGTGGWRIQWTPVALIAVVAALVAIINATSGIMEAQTGGAPVDPRAAWLQEISSVTIVIALSPLVGWAVWRFPPPARISAPAWGRVLGIHFAAATVFSLLHVAGMVALRKAGYATVGSTYVFAYQGDLVLPLVYEWRKDLLTYLSNAVAYWAWGFWLAHNAAQPAKAISPAAMDARIEIRDGARVVLFEPADIAWLEAAGNYVEIHSGGTTHLARGTMAAFEQKLAGRGFVRVHRSRLVNRARVTSFKPTPSGDLEITLDDGRTITGSRRYRAGMENA